LDYHGADDVSACDYVVFAFLTAINTSARLRIDAMALASRGRAGRHAILPLSLISTARTDPMDHFA